MIKRANTVKTSKSAGSRSLKTESSRIRDENRKKNKMVVQAGLPADYTGLVESIRDRVRKAQVKANLSVNRELVILYWEIGSLIVERQKKAGWGTGVIPSLARDLKSQLPGLKGFSERNLNRMTRFYDEYGQQFSILPQPVAKLQEEENSPKYVDLLEQGVILPQAVAKLQSGESGELQNLVFSLPWGHNILLIEKVKELDKRLWYMKKTIEHGWSRNVLALQIETDAYMRKAQAVTNFHLTLPDPLSDLAQQTLKDPYIFDFLTLDTKFRERELEMGLREQLEKFLLELGAGFAYVGKQVVLKVSQEEFLIDLLFYHLKLRCYVIIDLKLGKFKPEYAGKMNFYLNAVDDLLRHPDDKTSIGVILCQEKNRVVAEYALRGMKKPIGLSSYQLTRELPEELKSTLPSVEDIEAELKKRPGKAPGMATGP